MEILSPEEIQHIKNTIEIMEKTKYTVKIENTSQTQLNDIVDLNIAYNKLIVEQAEGINQLMQEVEILKNT